MTLIISVLFQDCVWQVADRRLTDVESGKVLSRDTNKVVLFAGCLLFGFTGPARLRGKDTASWIDRQTGMVGPRLLRFSNCIDPEGVWTGQLDDPVTVFDGIMKPGVLVNMRAAGQPVPLAVGRFWERQVRRRITASAPPHDVGRSLVQWVRDVAANNRAVGPGVLLSALPRAAVEAPSGFTIASMPSTDTPTFKYFPEGTLEGVEKGPEVVGVGGTRMSNFRSHTAPDGT